MSSDAFEFTMTLPGDTRLVGAARDLAAHAAKYAQLADTVGAALAEQVARAAEASIAATGTTDAPIQIRFVGDGQRLEVEIGSEVAAGIAVPASSAASGLSVAWSRAGDRQICRIVHSLSS